MIDSFGNYQKMLLRASQSRGTLRERLVRMVQTDFRATKEDAMRAKFVLRMIFSPGEQHPLFDYVKEMEEERRIIAGVLQEGIDDGSLRGNALDLATCTDGHAAHCDPRTSVYGAADTDAQARGAVRRPVAAGLPGPMTVYRSV